MYQRSVPTSAASEPALRHTGSFEIPRSSPKAERSPSPRPGGPSEGPGTAPGSAARPPAGLGPPAEQAGERRRQSRPAGRPLLAASPRPPAARESGRWEAPAARLGDRVSRRRRRRPGGPSGPREPPRQPRVGPAPGPRLANSAAARPAPAPPLTEEALHDPERVAQPVLPARHLGAASRAAAPPQGLGRSSPAPSHAGRHAWRGPQGTAAVAAAARELQATGRLRVRPPTSTSHNGGK